jgi:primosomal protein N'
LLYYTSEPTKKPKECIWSMLNWDNKNSRIENRSVEVHELQKPQSLRASPLSRGNLAQDISNLPDRIFDSAQDDVCSSTLASIDNSLYINQTSQNNNNYIAPKLQIILSTRSGLFLPFTALTDIILVDEGNSMYIQDQNSLYYDTREAIFLISKAFNANISFISPLPSIRLYNMYNKQALDQEMINNQAIAQKPRKIKVTRYDKKSSKYDLFGYEVEQILEGTKT